VHRALVQQGEYRRAYVAAASASAPTPAVVAVTRTELSAATGTEGRGTGRERRAKPTECPHCFFMHSHALASHSIQELATVAAAIIVFVVFVVMEIHRDPPFW
jgi:AhpD family alkylhydroperoxidase